MNFCYKIELPVRLADLLCGRDIKVMRDAAGKNVSKKTGALITDNGWQNTYIIA